MGLFNPAFGGVVEWSMAAVLKTVVLKGTGGSNPSASANRKGKSAPSSLECGFFFVDLHSPAAGGEGCRRSRNPGRRRDPSIPPFFHP